MCIASFVKSFGKTIVTFNRDEDYNRAFDPPPNNNDLNAFFPIDRLAGGTWIGRNSTHIMCLQNGARENHLRNLPYDISRGVMLRDLLLSGDTTLFYDYLSKFKIEPFMLSMLHTSSSELTVFYYDGKLLDKESHDINKSPIILLSSPLYDQSMKSHKISNFYKINPFTDKTILNFHLENRLHSKNIGTTSITQFTFEKNDDVKCLFLDLITNTEYHYQLHNKS